MTEKASKAEIRRLHLLRMVQIENVNAKLYIVGSGPLKGEIERYISSRELYNIKLLGFKSGQELIDIVGNARAVVLPSEWYENGPYSAIEALQVGRPIIGANIGGMWLYEKIHISILGNRVSVTYSKEV